MHKKIWMFGVAATLLGAVLTQPTLAQTGGGGSPGEHRGMGQLKKLADYLGLTDDQKAQIKPIMKSTAQQVKAVRSDTTLTPDAKKAKIKEIRKDSRQQIMAILTPDQKTKLAALRHHRSNQGGAGAAACGLRDVGAEIPGG